MGNSVAKDPNFPMKQVPITALKKNATNMVKAAQEADLLITRNSETVGYLVNPTHYEAMVEIIQDASERATHRFFENRQKRLGQGVDEAWSASLRGEHPSADQEAEVFGD